MARWWCETVSSMSSHCHNTPYRAHEAGVLSVNRGRLAAVLAADAEGQYRGTPVRPEAVFTPLQAFETLYGVRADPFIVRRVTECVRRGRASARYLRANHGDGEVAAAAAGAPVAARQDRPGWVYVFWDEDADPRGDALKIGSTWVTPSARVAQWRLELGHTLHLLYAYATPRARWSEEMLHELLRCQRDRGRVNQISGHELTEFFFIDNHRTLSRLVHAVTLFTRTRARRV